LWREACVRSAGFPARYLLAFCDSELAPAADNRGGPAGSAAVYAAAYTAAAERLPGIVAGIAKDRLFREAVLWQNPGLTVNCLEKISAAAPRNVKGRLRELAVAAYLQRYCLKNDTIGFFGPVAWASLSTTSDELVVCPGDTLLSERTTYFEVWAVNEVARVLAERGEVSGWLRPQRNSGVLLSGHQLYRPRRKPVVLSPAQLRMLKRCDGQRTVSELLAGPDADGLALLGGLRDLGAVSIDLAVPVQAWPERWLHEQIGTVGDDRARTAALRPLEEMVAARDRVAIAAGDPDKLRQAMVELAQTFERVTGKPSARRAGSLYAGRTLVYEDTVRDVTVRLGRQVTGALARPLGLVLDSARWLVAEIAGQYQAQFLGLLDRECHCSGTGQVPLLRLLAMAAPDLAPAPGSRHSDITARVVREFQDRWKRVLETPGDGGSGDPASSHSFSSADIEQRADTLFPPRPFPWSLASQHSPDIMIAASSAEAMSRGEFMLVLGEVHLASNTLESRCFVEQHPDQDRLLTAVTADQRGRRVVLIPGRDSPALTSRLTPPTALLSPEYTYLTAGDEVIIPPARSDVIPAASMLVEREGEDLAVRCMSSEVRLPLLEVIGDLMSGVVANAFSPVAPAPHQPRITIDRLVLSRESWVLPIAGAQWVFARDEATRYALARDWRAEHGLPERIFYRVPVEDKPMAADFRSLTMVNLLAKGVRHSKDSGFTSFSATEMLPDTGQLWLCDANGERYTSELRMVLVAETSRPHPPSR
jgi:hypothetical protein